MTVGIGSFPKPYSALDMVDAVDYLFRHEHGDESRPGPAHLELFDAGDGRTRAVWVADVLPRAAAETFDMMMGQGLAAMKRAFESAPTR